MSGGPDRRTGYEKFFGKSYRTHVNEGCMIATVVTVFFVGLWLLILVVLIANASA